MNIQEATNGIKAAIEEFSHDPPPQSVRQARSDICTGRLSGKKCPHNFQGAWRLTDTAAHIIKTQLERKRELALDVEGEDNLGTCEVCKCPLFLKVHYSWQTVYGHTSDDMFHKLHAANPECWMWAEREQYLKNQCNH